MLTREFLVVTISGAAPVVSDMAYHYVKGDTPFAALEALVRANRHPCGLFAANIYVNADAYHRYGEPLGVFRSLEALKKEQRPIAGTPVMERHGDSLLLLGYIIMAQEGGPRVDEEREKYGLLKRAFLEDALFHSIIVQELTFVTCSSIEEILRKLLPITEKILDRIKRRQLIEEAYADIIKAAGPSLTHPLTDMGRAVNASVKILSEQLVEIVKSQLQGAE